MKTRRTAVTRVVVALVAATVVVIATIIAASYLTGSPGTCPIYSAGPGRLDLRVVTDSNGTPISGAQVTATSISASYIAACAQGPSTTVKFTTSNEEWYPVNASDWPSGFSVAVTYSGQSYSFTVGVPVMDMVCREPLHPFRYDERHERRVLGHLPSADSDCISFDRKHFDSGYINNFERITDDHGHRNCGPNTSSRLHAGSFERQRESLRLHQRPGRG